jgi:hypothetical protein
MRMHEPQIRIVNHDHIAVITWSGTHIIVRGSKRSNFRKNTFKLKIQFLVFTENLAKQLVLVAKVSLKLGDSQRKTLEGQIITYIRVGVRYVPWRLANEANASEVTLVALDLLILLWAGGVITREVEVSQGSTRSGHDLLELLLITKAVLFLIVTLVAGVIPVIVVVVVLVGGL